MIVAFCMMVAVLLLLVAGLGDIAVRMVPNRLCLGLCLDGLIMRLFQHDLPMSLVAALAVSLPAMVCWRHRLMGGGDVKLLGASALLVPPGAVPLLVLAIALAGGLLAVAYWAMGLVEPLHQAAPPRQALRRILRVERHRIHRRFSLPYAIAIAAGTVYALGRTLQPGLVA